MTASWSGSMRGPRVKTPFLLLLLLSALTGTVLCQYDDDVGDPDAETDKVTGLEDEADDPEEPAVTDTAAVTEDPEPPAEVPTTSATISTVSAETYTDQGSGSGATQETYNTAEPSSSSPDEGLSPIIILIPVVLVVVIIGMIVCGIFINRRWNKKASNQELEKEDPYLDASSTEKVPMPMFEEDVPSVLELEMEELDEWMKKDG